MESHRDVLRSPLAIGACVVRNRLYRAPVLEGAGSGPEAPSVYAKTFGANAASGIGLIIQGNSCVTEEGRSSPGMTLVNTREATLALADVCAAVHKGGGKIFLQLGHAGIYAMEAWHRTHASNRKGPILAASSPRIHLKPALKGSPIKILETEEVWDLAAQLANSAVWAREAGYDGIQLASGNAKLIHQFLSPFYNRRTDEFGGSLRARARILEVMVKAVKERAGDDFPVAVKIPMKEDSPPLTPRTTFEEGVELCQMAESFGFDSITPVGLSVFPHASLCRGSYPKDILEVKSISDRFDEALGGSSLKKAVLKWGYRRAAKAYPFEPLWNRELFKAAKAAVDIPVFAVGGIRTLEEVNRILEQNEADMVGMGRPFYAEDDLAARILGGDPRPALCESSNRCVPAQQLGMKARCYNPTVAQRRRLLEADSD